MTFLDVLDVLLKSRGSAAKKTKRELKKQVTAHSRYVWLGVENLVS